MSEQFAWVHRLAARIVRVTDYLIALSSIIVRNAALIVFKWTIFLIIENGGLASRESSWPQEFIPDLNVSYNRRVLQTGITQVVLARCHAVPNHYTRVLDQLRLLHLCRSSLWCLFQVMRALACFILVQLQGKI